MPFFVIKSLISFALLLCALGAAAAMFEIFGRTDKPRSVDRLKRLHRIAGGLYVLTFLALSVLCISYLARDHSELSPRVTFHVVLALAILALFMLKVSYTRLYRQFYNQAKAIGVVMTVATFVMVFLSGGYYLVASDFGAHRPAPPEGQSAHGSPPSPSVEGSPRSAHAPDPGRSARGKLLFEEKCGFCHDAHGTRVVVGPGLKGLLRAPALPASKAPATLENVRRQLKKPSGRMPSFEHLSEEEISDLLAFLSTL